MEPDAPAPIDVLVENHRSFLRYLERKVGDRALAEDLLQDAFIKVAARPDAAPPDEALVPWFYRTLRNAAIDRFRRHGAAARALERFAKELDGAVPPDVELQAELCRCVAALAGTLTPEFADVLDAVEVKGEPVKAYADRHGLKPNTAAVRVKRAREALKRRVTESCGTCAEHGCRDCSCGRPAQDRR